MQIFTRSKLNPILFPIPAHAWEATKLYNPGAIRIGDTYHLYYRAMGTGASWQSVIGHATSADGEHFTRSSNPLLTPESPDEARGLEDPRVVCVGTTYIMSYAAFDGADVRIHTAESSDGYVWRKNGRALRGWDFSKSGGVTYEWRTGGKLVAVSASGERSKSAAIFPDTFHKRYMMLFGEFQVWFATSSDGRIWEGDTKPFLQARSGDYFDNAFVEVGPPPIMTEHGWLVLYHGIDTCNTYRLDALLLDVENPRIIRKRTRYPIFEPQESYECGGFVDVLPGGITYLQSLSPQERQRYIQKHIRSGTMPKVIFTCGAVPEGDMIRIYYGASDSVICTATARLSDILSLLE